MTKSQKFPLRWGKNQRKTSILDVSEQFRTTNFRFSTGKFCCETNGAVRCGVECLTDIGMRLYYLQHLFTSCIGAVSDVFRGVGSRFYHSEKAFTSCIGVVLDVFARVRSRLYHSQKLFTSCILYTRCPMFSRV